MLRGMLYYIYRTEVDMDLVIFFFGFFTGMAIIPVFILTLCIYDDYKDNITYKYNNNDNNEFENF